MEDGAQRFIPFETPVAVRLGLGTAIDHALDLGIDAIAARVGSLAEELRTLLGGIAGIAVHDGGRVRCGIVTFTVDGHAPAEVAAAARAAGVNVSVTDRPAARLDLGGDRPAGVVRASPALLQRLRRAGPSGRGRVRPGRPVRVRAAGVAFLVAGALAACGGSASAPPTTDPGLLAPTAAEPSATTGVEAALRPVWQAIVHNDPTAAHAAFFPRSAYLRMKAGEIRDPSSDYAGRLLGMFDQDIGAYASTSWGATRPVRPSWPSRPIPVTRPGYRPGTCKNSIGYWHLPGARFVYRAHGRVRSFAVASLISWRGAWYVVHLGPNPRAFPVGSVDLPERGRGDSGAARRLLTSRPGHGQAGRNGLPWPGTTNTGRRANSSARDASSSCWSAARGSMSGPWLGPPQVGARHQAAIGLDQGGDVLGRVPRRRLQADRGAQLEAVGLPVGPDVVLVDGPVVVEPCLGEQGGVQGVVGMMVAEDHVGHLAGVDAQRGQRVQDQAPTGHHARIDDDDGVAVADQHHGARHPVVRIPLGQDVEPCRHRASRRPDRP